MSATAFQRMRREALAKEQQDQEETSEGLTVKQIKNLLKDKAVEFDPKAKKEDLIKLLEGAE
jgi:hypothetical protein